MLLYRKKVCDQDDDERMKDLQNCKYCLKEKKSDTCNTAKLVETEVELSEASISG